MQKKPFASRSPKTQECGANDVFDLFLKETILFELLVHHLPAHLTVSEDSLTCVILLGKFGEK